MDPNELRRQREQMHTAYSALRDRIDHLEDLQRELHPSVDQNLQLVRARVEGMIDTLDLVNQAGTVASEYAQGGPVADAILSILAERGQQWVARDAALQAAIANGNMSQLEAARADIQRVLQLADVLVELGVELYGRLDQAISDLESGQQVDPGELESIAEDIDIVLGHVEDLQTMAQDLELETESQLYEDQDADAAEGLDASLSDEDELALEALIACGFSEDQAEELLQPQDEDEQGGDAGESDQDDLESDEVPDENQQLLDDLIAQGIEHDQAEDILGQHAGDLQDVASAEDLLAAAGLDISEEEALDQLEGEQDTQMQELLDYGVSMEQAEQIMDQGADVFDQVMAGLQDGIDVDQALEHAIDPCAAEQWMQESSEAFEQPDFAEFAGMEEVQLQELMDNYSLDAEAAQQHLEQYGPDVEPFFHEEEQYDDGYDSERE